MEDKKTYFTSEVVQTESKSTISDKTVVDKIRTPYLPFGTDNLFPQGMALLGRRAAIHRAIISNKVTYTIGKGFVKPKNRNLRKYIRSVNANGQSLESLCSMLFHDHWSQGNVYLELITDKNGNFLNMHHRDATTARRSVDGTCVLFHPKWSVWAANKMHTEDIPLYPNFVQKGEFYHSVYHFKKYEPEFPNYGLPTWVAGLDAAGIAYKTNRWNLSRLNNSFIQI